jgi:hypothetical protein
MEKEKLYIDNCKNMFSFFGEARKKKNPPTQLENRLCFLGELMEFNHSLALVFY